MVNLVLQQFGESTFCLDVFSFTPFIEKRDLHRVVSLNVRKNIGEREAIVPQAKPFSAFPDDRGIDERSGIVKVDVDDLLRGSDLRRCNATAESAARPELGERIAQICDDRASVVSGGGVHRTALLTKNGIAQEKDVSCGHRGLLQ